MPLSLSVFGAFQASWNEQPITFATSAARALLAYLALEADQPHARELLGDMLWPDQPQANAYANLRQTLARLRKVFPDSTDVNDVLTIRQQTLQFTGTAVIDVVRFEALLTACAAHAHTEITGCPACIARLEEATALYRGELLHGLFLDHSQPFEEWLLVRREVLHRQALDALHTLTNHYEGAGDYARMRDYAARQVALEPWREEAHRALMRALAYGGQRAAALAQYDMCCRVLDQEFGAAPANQTIALYEQIKTDLLHPTAPSPPSQHPPTPLLPVSPTPLLGRAEELAVIVARLADGDCRLVTLTGPGGVGKTHLGLEAARALQPAFNDGVAFVSLAAISEPDQVLLAIAHALDVHTSPKQSVLRSVTDALRDKRLLLVLDNFEQVVAAAPRIGELLAHAPHLKLLVTSRAALRLRAEHEIAVAPLALPMPPWTAATIAAAPAVALFVQRAQAIAPAFALTNANASAIVAICTHLDGLPLAIELAAPRIKLLSPQQLLQRLNGRLDLLRGGMQDLPIRHQTLRNTITWSYTLLAAHEQQLFARLTVFVGGGTIDAIEAICHGDGPDDLLDGLQSLIDQSLLRQIVGEDAVPRLTMLETIRDYGVEQLRASGEADAMHGKHAAYYLQLAEAAAPELAGGSEQVAWFGRVAAETDNFRAALRWAVDHTDAVTALRLGTALREFWMTRAYLDEGRAWLEAALALEDHASEQTDAVLRGSALTTAGWLAANGRDYSAAEQLFAQSLALAYRIEDSQQILTVLGDLGQAARMQRNTQRATALYEERLVLSREVGDTRSTAWTLCNLGIIAHGENDARVAALLEEGITLSQALGDRICTAWCLTFLARVAKDRGEYSQSAALFAETLALFHDVGHADGIAFTLEGLAGLAAAEGNLRAAARLFGAAEALREAISRPQSPYVRDLDVVQIEQENPAWQAAWVEGRAISVEQIDATVLEVTLCPAMKDAFMNG